MTTNELIVMKEPEGTWVKNFGSHLFLSLDIARARSNLVHTSYDTGFARGMSHALHIIKEYGVPEDLKARLRKES